MFNLLVYKWLLLVQSCNLLYTVCSVSAWCVIDQTIIKVLLFSLPFIWLLIKLMTSYWIVQVAIYGSEFQYSSACRFKIPCPVLHSRASVSSYYVLSRSFPYQNFIRLCICCTTFLRLYFLDFSMLVSSFLMLCQLK